MSNIPTPFSTGRLAREYPPMVGDAAWAVYWNDFTRPTDYDTNDWTLTTVEAGAGSATEAIGNLAGGILVITNDNADDDADWFQSTREVFRMTLGQRTLFGIRFKVSDATQIDVAVGLQITDTTPLAVTDGIYFRKDDGDAFLDFVVIKDSVATTVTAVGTLVNDTHITLGFEYDGASAVYPWVDGVRQDPVAVTNLPNDEELAISFGIQNGEAAAKIMSVDYIYAAQERG